MVKGQEIIYQEPNDENIEDFLKILDEHRQSCEQEGKYVEAEMAKNRINELKIQDYERRMATKLMQQAQQREDCEQAHIKQYQQFNQWDEDLLQTQQEDSQALAELEDRQTKEIENNRQILEENLPLTFKYSAELLNKQKIQAQFAKQRDYAAAH